MKKGLLLSVVASAIVFAGGDIQPVEPVAPASSDFWGQVGFAYQSQKDEWGNLTGLNDVKFGDEENNDFSAVAILGVEKEWDFGIGFGLELAGWTDFDAQIADNARVASADQTNSEISQAYVTYKYCNTAIKAGRQALPKAVSPWAWSDRSAGVLDLTYEGVVLANTDLPDTTLVGAWMKNAVNGDDKINISDDGLFALAIINKSITNTTLTLTGYYVPESQVVKNSLGQQEDIYSVWGSLNTRLNNWSLGLQGAYVDGKFKTATGADWDATYGIAAKLGSDWLSGDLHTEITGWYINDGDYSLKTAGSGAGTSGFWGNSFGGEFNGEAIGYDRTGGRLDFSYKVLGGKIFGGAGYEDFDGKAAAEIDNQVGGRIGYKTEFMGLETTVQYRYLDVKAVDSGYDHTRQKIRVEAYYKF